MSDKIKYKLYAAALSEDNLKNIENERFYRITQEYMLVYTSANIKKKSFIEVTENELGRLTERDKDWLLDCNMILIAEASKQNEKNILKSVNEQIIILEKALEKEQAELTERDTNNE